jgi:hypothetical protein
MHNIVSRESWCCTLCLLVLDWKHDVPSWLRTCTIHFYWPEKTIILSSVEVHQFIKIILKHDNLVVPNITSTLQSARGGEKRTRIQ